MKIFEYLILLSATIMRLMMFLDFQNRFGIGFVEPKGYITDKQQKIILMSNVKCRIVINSD